MDALSTELRRELIGRVYPDLRHGGDPDIDRYFEYRRDGRLSDALGLYNGPLRTRYPDDQSRIVLLKLYREGDPRRVDFQDRLILQLAGRIAVSLSRNIDVLALPLANARLTNAFHALSAVESLLKIVPGRDAGAIAFLDTYLGFARLLGHRAAEMERARALVGEYLAMARADSPADYDFVARSRALEERKKEAAARARAGAQPEAARETRSVDFIARSEALEERRRREAQTKARWFDLSKIRFNATDKARIEISEVLSRREDKVLAYCWKYWTLVADPGFERLVFIYSRKYGTSHYAIFRAVKVGRAMRSTDDEILTAVSGLLSTSYSYSVSGDLYLQANWRRLKARAEAERAAAAVAALPPDRKDVMGHASHEDSQAVTRRALLRDLGPRDREAAASGNAPPASSPSPEASRRDPGRDLRRDPRRDLRYAAPAARAELKPLSPASKTARGADLGTRRPPASPVGALSARTGSVSDRIRKLSGKAYDVYRQLFLERVRDDIHRSLLASRTRAFRLFDETANAAEDIVYAFMTAHYADPFMNWEGSDERARVEALGYALPSLDPIIGAWYRRL